MQPGPTWYSIRDRGIPPAAIIDLPASRKTWLARCSASRRSSQLNLADVVVVDIREMSALLSIGFEFYAAAGRNDSVREFLRGYYHEYRTLLVGLIQRGIDSGEFRPINPDDIAIVLIALFEGMNLLLVTDPESLDPEHMIRAGISAVVDGISSSAG